MKFCRLRQGRKQAGQMRHPAQVRTLHCVSINRLRVVWIARRVSSQATKLRPCLEATNGVVPDPQKKSATISPGLDEARMILSSNASGFWVGYPVRSLCNRATTGKYHQSSGTLPRSRSGTLPNPAFLDDLKVLTVFGYKAHAQHPR
jgi:hypothetical protein